MRMHRTVFTLALAALLAAPAAQAVTTCTPFLCYFDAAVGATICPNRDVYEVLSMDPVVHDDCEVGCWNAAVIKVDVPEGCDGISVWVEYQGDSIGWTAHLTDSRTGNGFGGDAGTAPAGQNAEIHVLDDELFVYAAGNAPELVDNLVRNHMALRDGALRIVAENQFVSWGQPYSSIETGDRELLFFLPESPVAPENRTLYVGLNRTVGSAARNGCGLRRAIITVH